VEEHYREWEGRFGGQLCLGVAGSAAEPVGEHHEADRRDGDEQADGDPGELVVSGAEEADPQPEAGNSERNVQKEPRRPDALGLVVASVSQPGNGEGRSSESGRHPSDKGAPRHQSAARLSVIRLRRRDGFERVQRRTVQDPAVRGEA
jgi:hypothetical protein